MFLNENQEDWEQLSFNENPQEEEQIYQRIKELLILQPHFKPGLAAYESLLISVPRCDLGFTGVISNRHEKTVASLDNDFVALRVIKRMYDETIGFQDLDQHLKDCLRKQIGDKGLPYEHVGGYLEIYRSFPHLLQDFRIHIAQALLYAWQDEGKVYEDLHRNQSMQDKLLHIFEELRLQPVDLARTLASFGVSQIFFIPALQADLFGSNWLRNLDRILRTVLNELVGELGVANILMSIKNR